MRGWVYDPHSGGVKIPAVVRQRTERRIQSHAEARYAGKFIRPLGAAVVVSSAGDDA